jgi:hypothetical protein
MAHGLDLVETEQAARRNPEKFVRWKSKKNSEENS